jgi:helix-turn-helix protein
MWEPFEPVHAVTYFAPQSRAAFEAVGLRGFWRGYFAGRAAPLGAVDAAPVYAAFFSFALPFVARALPHVWALASPEVAIEARRAGARAALTAIATDAEVDEVATLLRAAAEPVETGGRVLSAANAALPWPEQPLDMLWHATTILREHRGDGHVAALVTAGVNGSEAMLWQAALRGQAREDAQKARGWADEDWAAALVSVTRRGWLDEGGRPTDAGRAARVEVEALTDRLATGPWRELGEARTQRCAELLTPLAQRAATLLTWPNPIGVPDPRRP